YIESPPIARLHLRNDDKSKRRTYCVAHGSFKRFTGRTCSYFYFAVPRCFAVAGGTAGANAISPARPSAVGAGVCGREGANSQFPRRIARCLRADRTLL